MHDLISPPFLLYQFTMARGRRAATAPVPPPANVTMTNAQLTTLIAALGAQQNPQNQNNNVEATVRRGTHKEFMDGKPLSFEGTEGPIGLLRWYEKAEAVLLLSTVLSKIVLSLLPARFWVTPSLGGTPTSPLWEGTLLMLPRGRSLKGC